MSTGFRIGGGPAVSTYSMPAAAPTTMPYNGASSYQTMGNMPLNAATTMPRAQSYTMPATNVRSMGAIPSTLAPTVTNQSIAPPPPATGSVYQTLPSMGPVGTVQTLAPGTQSTIGTSSYPQQYVSAPNSQVITGADGARYVYPSQGNIEPVTQQPQQQGFSYADAPIEDYDPLAGNDDDGSDSSEDGEDAGNWKFSAVKKPPTKWRSGKDVPGDWPIEHPQASHGIQSEKIVDHSKALAMHTKKDRDTATAPEMSLIQEEKPWPFWIGAGTPAARLEPTWIDGSWYLVAPVDFKGLERLPKDIQRTELNTVDDALRELDANDRVPSLPPPRHWKEHKNCPIA